MKKITTILAVILLLAVSMTAQNPKLSYSAVVRNSANELVANENITVAVAIANGVSGTAVYAETHNVTTNANGMVSLTIGEGTGATGSLADVTWKTAYITATYTLPGGATVTNTVPVSAVPYALYADNVSAEAVGGAVADYLATHGGGSYTETDPTVPAWAKEATKPAYDYSEIANTPTIPTTVAELTDAANYATTADLAAKANAADVYTRTETDNLLSDKANVTDIHNSTITIQKNGDMVGSFTLNQAGDQTINLTVPSGGGGIPQTISISGNVITLSDGGGSVTLPAESDPTVPAWAKEANKPAYDYSEIANTPDLSGYLTAETDPTVPDWAKEATKPSYDYSEIANTPDLSGYLTAETDPTVPDWAKEANKPAYDYSEITGTPTLPTVNDGTLTIQKNGETVGTFTANQPGTSTVNITITAQDIITAVNSMTNEEKAALCSALNCSGGGTTYVQPTVTTSAATSVTQTSATLNGEVSNPDNVTITAQGFEWKTTTGGTYAAVNATGETMTYNLTGLTAGTSYTYRAFVTTAEGTSYGSEVDFTTTAGTIDPTSFTCGTSKMVDADGNEYETVLIGTQCWTKTNLRVAPVGATDATSSGATSYTEPYYYVNSAVNPAVYGYYYNWEAAKLACPTGWHLPSDAEWTQLTNYVSSQSEFQCGGNSSYIAKALASKTTDWNSSSNTCAVGNNTAANNDAGFSAVPAGYCSGSSFHSAGNGAYFWSSAQNLSLTAWDRYLYYSYADVNRSFNDKYNGFSVRCLRDETGGGTTYVQPTVTTSAATDITATSATLNGNVSNPDNVTITAQGFEWKTTTGGTYAAVNATGETMTYNLTGLTAGTSYTYRAFVTTAEGTTYGSEVEFTTTAATTFTCGTSKMVDADGNEYATVLIGTQCWTKTNLRVAPAGATDATSSGANSNTEPYYYVKPGVDAATYGYYYNWEAAKLACPTGWHLPSDAEWTQLTNYVSSQSEFQCGGNSSYIAKALASKTTDWNSSSNTCAVGNNTAANNDAGFSAVPAGGCYGSSFNGAGNYADFWSSTQSDSSNAYGRNLYYGSAYVGRYNDSKSNGFSVRCLRD